MLPLYHCTKGMGLPLALQYSIPVSPTLIVYGDWGAMVICGASKLTTFII